MATKQMLERRQAEENSKEFIFKSERDKQKMISLVEMVNQEYCCDFRNLTVMLKYYKMLKAGHELHQLEFDDNDLVPQQKVDNTEIGEVKDFQEKASFQPSQSQTLSIAKGNQNNSAYSPPNSPTMANSATSESQFSGRFTPMAPQPRNQYNQFGDAITTSSMYGPSIHQNPYGGLFNDIAVQPPARANMYRVSAYSPKPPPPEARRIGVANNSVQPIADIGKLKQLPTYASNSQMSNLPPLVNKQTGSAPDGTTTRNSQIRKDVDPCKANMTAPQYDEGNLVFGGPQAVQKPFTIDAYKTGIGRPQRITTMIQPVGKPPNANAPPYHQINQQVKPAFHGATSQNIVANTEAARLPNQNTITAGKPVQKLDACVLSGRQSPNIDTYSDASKIAKGNDCRMNTVSNAVEPTLTDQPLQYAQEGRRDQPYRTNWFGRKFKPAAESLNGVQRVPYVSNVASDMNNPSSGRLQSSVPPTTKTETNLGSRDSSAVSLSSGNALIKTDRLLRINKPQAAFNYKQCEAIVKASDSSKCGPYQDWASNSNCPSQQPPNMYYSDHDAAKGTTGPTDVLKQSLQNSTNNDVTDVRYRTEQRGAPKIKPLANTNGLTGAPYSALPIAALSSKTNKPNPPPFSQTDSARDNLVKDAYNSAHGTDQYSAHSLKSPGAAYTVRTVPHSPLPKPVDLHPSQRSAASGEWGNKNVGSSPLAQDNSTACKAGPAMPLKDLPKATKTNFEDLYRASSPVSYNKPYGQLLDGTQFTQYARSDEFSNTDTQGDHWADPAEKQAAFLSEGRNTFLSSPQGRPTYPYKCDTPALMKTPVGMSNNGKLSETSATAHKIKEADPRKEQQSSTLNAQAIGSSYETKPFSQAKSLADPWKARNSPSLCKEPSKGIYATQRGINSSASVASYGGMGEVPIVRREEWISKNRTALNQRVKRFQEQTFNNQQGITQSPPASVASTNGMGGVPIIGRREYDSSCTVVPNQQEKNLKSRAVGVTQGITQNQSALFGNNCGMGGVPILGKAEYGKYTSALNRQEQNIQVQPTNNQQTQPVQRAILGQPPSLISPRATANSAAKPTSGIKMISRENVKCLICKDRCVGITITPCRHVVICRECAPRTNECPKCLEPVGRMHLF